MYDLRRSRLSSEQDGRAFSASHMRLRPLHFRDTNPSMTACQRFTSAELTPRSLTAGSRGEPASMLNSTRDDDSCAERVVSFLRRRADDRANQSSSSPTETHRRASSAAGLKATWASTSTPRSSDGLMTMLDAGGTLASFMTARCRTNGCSERSSDAAIDATCCSIVAPGAACARTGEMVNVLWQDGNPGSTRFVWRSSGTAFVDASRLLADVRLRRCATS